MNLIHKKANEAVLLIACLMAMPGCSDDSMMSSGGTDTGLHPISISGSLSVDSRADDAGFADADVMGVFIADYSNGKPTSLADDNLHADNVKYTFSEADGSWTGATTLYWNDKTTPIDVYGYYPFVSDMSDPTAYSFSVERRQDTPASASKMSAYEASDFLWAKAGGISPTGDVIRLTYTHAMAGVTVRLVAGAGFSATEFAGLTKSIWVENTVTNAVVDIEKQSAVAADGTLEKVYPLEYNGDYRAVVVPQTVAAGKTVIGMTIDGRNYALKRSDAINFASGKMHTFTVTVDKKGDSGDYEVKLAPMDVTAWVDDPDFHEGLVRQYITVDVPSPGSLHKVCENLRLDIAKVENLKLTGTVNCEDFRYIQQNQSILQGLNLYNVTIDNEGSENDGMLSDLGNCKLLHRIIFPRELKGFCNSALNGCDLIGSLVIPEGVVVIGSEAFGNNLNLTGSIKLPSTLKRIESGAFIFVPLTGELLLPEGLEFIGNGAFPSSNFTGSLILPQSIKELGYDTGDYPGRAWGASIIKGIFTGNLTIPQGISLISPFAFNSAKFSGCLILPEGLKCIRENAFSGCGFVGELELPVSVKEIGNSAFASNRFSKIVWSDNVTSLGTSVFENNTRLLGSVSMPRKVSAIPENLFRNCSLVTGVELHEDMEYVGDNAFHGCYQINSIVCHAANPPLINGSSFDGVSRDNFSVEVPESSVPIYKQDKRWGEFKRITSYKNFIVRPQSMCALNSRLTKTFVLNADGDWTVTHIPEWCSISANSGSGKHSLTVSIKDLPSGAPDRTDYIEFKLRDKDNTTRIDVSQFDYEYSEDQKVTLQAHSKGNGIKIMVVPDGWTAEQIASGAFIDQAVRNMEYFFGLSPYDRYRDYFDFYAFVALSQESGVNTLNNYVDTKFKTIYSGVTTSLIPDPDLVFNFLKDGNYGITDMDIHDGLVMLVPNTIEYGGITFYYEETPLSVCPPSVNAYPNDARGMIQHEACGHGFGKLGDESISNNAYVSRNVVNTINTMHSLGWYRNISLSGKMNEVAWKDLVFNPRYSDIVDVYEGAMGYSRGVFRSESNSCMNFGIPYFNTISRMAITERILKTAGEQFDLDDFYANDSRNWGNSTNSRDVNGLSLPIFPAYSNHCTPVSMPLTEARKMLEQLRNKQNINLTK